MGDVEKWVIWNGMLGLRQGRNEDTVKDPSDEVRDLTVDIAGNVMPIMSIPLSKGEVLVPNAQSCPEQKVRKIFENNFT